MGDMADYDLENLHLIEQTYCKKHPGRWEHECGCINNKIDAYLGDGVYVQFDGLEIMIYTQGGNEIFLEPPALNKFLMFIDKFVGRKK